MSLSCRRNVAERHCLRRPYPGRGGALDLTPFLGPSATFLATLVALFIALFKDDYVKWRWKPTLRASIRLAAPDCEPGRMQLTIQAEDGSKATTLAPCYIFRMRIENCGKEKAEHVQVYVAEASTEWADGTYQPIDGFLPLKSRMVL